MTSCTMLFLWNPPSSIKVLMSSRLLRCSTTRGSYARFSLVLIASSTNQRFVYCQWVGNENIISQIDGGSKVCDHNGDRVSKNDKSSHNWSIMQKGVILKIGNMSLCLCLLSDKNGLTLTPPLFMWLLVWMYFFMSYPKGVFVIFKILIYL